MAIPFGQLAQGYDGTGIPAPTPNPTPEQQQQYHAGWLETFQRPEVMAMLGQFGANISQPTPIGQTDLGAFTSAAAGGQEAYDRNVIAQEKAASDAEASAQRQQQLATQSRAVDVTQQGNQLDYNAKLEAVAARERAASVTSADRMAIARLGADTREQASLLAAASKWNTDQANKSIYSTPEAPFIPEPFPAEEMLRQIRGAQSSAGVSGGSTPASPAPVPGGGAPAAEKAPVSSGAMPFEPNPQKRSINQVYDLPNGKQGLWSHDPASGKVGWELLN